MTVRFDDSLSVLLNVLEPELGVEALKSGTLLRDATGRLTFFAARALDDDIAKTLSAKLGEALGAYARTDRVIAAADDPGAAAVHGDPCRLPVIVDGARLHLVDRRLVGADWLRAPEPLALLPPRFVFASLKGGVGRSTALAVVAAHLASRGQRVLGVDLDMEAPGLGALLLTEDTLPDFGIIDALVENGLSGLDEEFYADLVGPSKLASKGGRIDIIPALGRRSLGNPADVLAKIARAYAEDMNPSGTPQSILDQVRAIIDHLAESDRYDAILVDARSGLHETTASAVLGLGAEVLLFGLDEPQTFYGYEVMLAHLSRFVGPGAPLPDWVERLTMVQGKAPADAEERRYFSERCRDLFSKAGLGAPLPAKPTEVSLPAEPFNEVPWDDDLADEDVLPPEGSLRDAVTVLHDENFRRFDPLQNRDQVAEKLYQTTFGDLLDRVDEVLQSLEEDL